MFYSPRVRCQTRCPLTSHCLEVGCFSTATISATHAAGQQEASSHSGSLQQKAESPSSSHSADEHKSDLTCVTVGASPHQLFAWPENNSCPGGLEFDRINPHTCPLTAVCRTVNPTCSLRVSPETCSRTTRCKTTTPEWGRFSPHVSGEG